MRSTRTGFSDGVQDECESLGIDSPAEPLASLLASYSKLYPLLPSG